MIILDFIRKWILESRKKIRKIPKGIQENFWDSKSTGEQTAGMKREKMFVFMTIAELANILKKEPGNGPRAAKTVI